jgi:exodeoxyribonuclease-3
MKIVSWNINGLKAIFRKGFADFVGEVQPDVLCLQETKVAQENLPQELSLIKNHHQNFVFAQKKGYSGVATFNKIQPKIATNIFENEKFNNEGRVIVNDYEKFLLFNVYFPNGKKNQERLQYKLDFYEEFLKLIKKYQKINPNIIICGDVNTAHQEIDLSRPKPNSKTSGFLEIERTWIDKLLASNFIDSWRHFHPNEPNQYTWWDYKTRARSRNIGWRIDYFFLSKPLVKYLMKAEIHHKVLGSDHCSISIEINI